MPSFFIDVVKFNRQLEHTLKRSISVVTFSFLLAMTAQASPVITVYSASAPNGYGSPSFTPWVANTLAAVEAGQTSGGTPGGPAYYQAETNMDFAQAVATGFNSWNGQADPGSVFSPFYVNELGKRIHFPLLIDGKGTEFSIADMKFNAVATGNSLLTFGADYGDPSFGYGQYQYSSQYVGHLKGSDGILFTNDDVLVTGGLNTQLVDGLVGRGSGNANPAYCSGCTTAQQQVAIQTAINQLAGTTSYIGIYTVKIGEVETVGSATVNFSETPEPSTLLTSLGAGLVIWGLYRRSLRKRDLVPANQRA